MLLAQNCLDVGGLTGCNLILICLYGFGVGGLTLIGGSLRGLAGGNYGGYSGVSLSLCGFSCGDNGKALCIGFCLCGSGGLQDRGAVGVSLCLCVFRVGIDSGHKIIVVGVGHLGHALLQNFDFDKVGFRIDSAFDVSPALIGTEIRSVAVRSMDELEEYVANYHPDVAVLTVPQSVAQPLADRLIGLGVRGFWNFTNVELSTDEPGVFFEDIHFVDTLLTLSYRISRQ